jgi:hypothetical protein
MVERSSRAATIAPRPRCTRGRTRHPLAVPLFKHSGRGTRLPARRFGSGNSPAIVSRDVDLGQERISRRGRHARAGRPVPWKRRGKTVPGGRGGSPSSVGARAIRLSWGTISARHSPRRRGSVSPRRCGRLESRPGTSRRANRRERSGATRAEWASWQLAPRAARARWQGAPRTIARDSPVRPPTAGCPPLRGSDAECGTCLVIVWRRDPPLSLHRARCGSRWGPLFVTQRRRPRVHRNSARSAEFRRNSATQPDVSR